MNLSIIIPNYNGEKLLSKNLPKILDAARNYKAGDVEIIIPDDPSTDNSKLVIENFINSIKEKNIRGKTVVNRDKKLAGFSRNVNRGVEIASGDLLILFNSDVAPSVDFLHNVLEHFENPELFAVGFMDESIEKGKKILRGRGLGEFKKGFLVHKAGAVNKSNTLWVSGGSSAYRKSIWDKLKGFDSIYDPFYWEDIDLSYRALKSGYEIMFDPTIVVVHEHEKGTVKQGFTERYVKTISYRNQFIFVWKNITDHDLLLNHILWLPYNFIQSIYSRDWAFIYGFYLAIWKLPQIQKLRSDAHRLATKEDKEVLKSYNR